MNHQKIAKILRYILIFIALFHIIFGLGFMFSPEFQAWAAKSYGAEVAWNSQTIYFVRVVGSFAFVLGTLAAFAARDPLQHKVVILGFIEFFILRDFHRHLYGDELLSAFGVTPLTNILTSAFFATQALFLVWLLYKVRQIDASA